MSARIEFTQPITPPTPPTPPYSPDYGSFYSINSGQFLGFPFEQLPISVTNTTFSKNITAIGSQIVFSNPAIYNIEISVQVSNNSTQSHLFYLWFKQNGNDIFNSASVVTIPSTHGGHAGHFILSLNIFVETLIANEYVEVFWTADNTGVYLETIGSIGGVPNSPMMILTATQVS